jgi:hypothetical protein
MLPPGRVELANDQPEESIPAGAAAGESGARFGAGGAGAGSRPRGRGAHGRGWPGWGGGRGIVQASLELRRSCRMEFCPPTPPEISTFALPVPAPPQLARSTADASQRRLRRRLPICSFGCLLQIEPGVRSVTAHVTVMARVQCFCSRRPPTSRPRDLQRPCCYSNPGVGGRVQSNTHASWLPAIRAAHARLQHPVPLADVAERDGDPQFLS